MDEPPSLQTTGRLKKGNSLKHACHLIKFIRTRRKGIFLVVYHLRLLSESHRDGEGDDNDKSGPFIRRAQQSKSKDRLQSAFSPKFSQEILLGLFLFCAWGAWRFQGSIAFTSQCTVQEWQNQEWAVAMAIVKFSFTALVFAWVSSAAPVESEWTIFLKFEYKCG